MENVFLHYENQVLAAATKKRELPCCLVTGFLGSGKSTLLSHILKNKSNLRISAAVNDFAQLKLDTTLFEATEGGEDVVEAGSKDCLCCHTTSYSQFEEQIWRILQRDDSSFLDYLLKLVVQQIPGLLFNLWRLSLEN